MIGTTELTLQQLQERLPTIESMFEFLDDQGWYTPDFRKKGNRIKCWSKEYAWDLITGKEFKIKREKVRVPPANIRNAAKEEIANEINRISQEAKINTRRELPPKQWLKNILYSIEPTNQLFQKPTEKTTVGSQVVPEE